MYNVLFILTILTLDWSTKTESIVLKFDILTYIVFNTIMQVDKLQLLIKFVFLSGCNLIKTLFISYINKKFLIAFKKNMSLNEYIKINNYLLFILFKENKFTAEKLLI